MHGTRTSSAIWRPQAAALRAHGHPVIAVDLPGHGARQHERFTLEGALATIDAAVRSCDRPPLLVGLSLGGYASLAYAGRYGERVAGVMLSGCSAEIKGKPVGLFRRVASRVTGWLHAAPRPPPRAGRGRARVPGTMRAWWPCRPHRRRP